MRLAFDGQPLADLCPMLHQQLGAQNLWLHPQSARIAAVRENALLTAVDMDCTFTGAPAAGGAHAARVTMRYWIPKHSDWLASEGVSVVNTDARPWRLGALYHSCTPLSTGAVAQIETLCDVQDYYQALTGWADRAQNRAVACWVPGGSKLRGFFWKDAPLAFHSDLREPADVLLQPGETWHATPTPVLWFAVPEASRAASAAAAHRCAAQAGLQ